MFAIRIAEGSNLKKIRSTRTLSLQESESVRKLFTRSEHYFVTGYVDDRGMQHDWVVFPEFIFRELFHYDPEKIQNDWDIVVKLKPSEPEARLPYKE